MQIIEIRDLDGPNLFLLEPAIKIELMIAPGEPVSPALQAFLGAEGRDDGQSAGEAFEQVISLLHERAGLPRPSTRWEPLEFENHHALAFSWDHRRCAMAVARLFAALVTDQVVDVHERIEEIARLAESYEPGDRPLMVRDDERSIPIIGITGTNGKTTTTRLTVHILREAGLKVGWSSSSGVYIEGEEVLEGDYTGPAGARRVLDQPGIDIAVLETARGGILLRGIAYQSNDVGVFTNVSADHLGLQGIYTIEGLTRVKSTVVRVTRPEGFAVLNADDPLVRDLKESVRAQVVYVSQDSQNPIVQAHVAAGGTAVVVDDGWMVIWRDGEREALLPVSDAPITLEGRARHMVENALCAAAACLAVGRRPEEVAAGLRSFRNDPEHNLGRLNLFDVAGVKVVIDFAHNEAGLRHLLGLARSFAKPSARVTAIIGTAGDRTDEALSGIGRIAAQQSDRVLIKETAKYLRGRASNAEMNALYERGLREGGAAEWAIAPTEVDAIRTALADAAPGDVIAMMCLEQIPEVEALLTEQGHPFA